jgi:hypothetical protein
MTEEAEKLIYVYGGMIIGLIMGLAIGTLLK